VVSTMPSLLVVAIRYYPYGLPSQTLHVAMSMLLSLARRSPSRAVLKKQIDEVIAYAHQVRI